MFKIHFLPQNLVIDASEGEDLLSVQIRAGLNPDAPCAGKGTCGKCLVDIQNTDGSSETVKACQYYVSSDLTVRERAGANAKILDSGVKRAVELSPRFSEGLGAAFDIGTTSVVCYLLDLKTGTQLARASMLNPQKQFGADVISRCEYAINGGLDTLTKVIRDAVNELIKTACKNAKANRKAAGLNIDLSPENVQLVTVAGNTCMHHLFMNIDPRSLTVIPYEAKVKDEIVMKAADADIRIHPEGILQVLPNIAGFVGADTVACMLATEFDKLEDLTLMIDIGTNGEMVMGNKDRMIVCSTAAGPAFEGAKLDCGMRATTGAIDHIQWTDGKLICHILGQEDTVPGSSEDPDAAPVKPVGICGSGLMDAVAAGLDAGIIDESGRLDEDHELVFKLPDSGMPAIRLAGDVYLSQKDIREAQLAKGAFAAGIELLADSLGIRLDDLRKVMIAGAFGNYMNPHSACRMGMIPMELEDRIEMIGNAAGEGSIIATLSLPEYLRAAQIQKKADFLELASSEDFQDIFVENLLFES